MENSGRPASIFVLPTPYMVRNAPVQSLELITNRGCVPVILEGRKANRIMTSEGMVNAPRRLALHVIRQNQRRMP